MQPQESYKIKLPQFEGPFDLLLFFIERDELDIYDIPITGIINDFLAFMLLSIDTITFLILRITAYQNNYEHFYKTISFLFKKHSHHFRTDFDMLRIGKFKRHFSPNCIFFN